MKATELRIKNLFQDKLTGELLEVGELTERTTVFKVIDRRSFPLPDGWEAEPIPLTEEWLLKFGFEKINNSEFVHHNTCICFDPHLLCFLDEGRGAIDMSHITHVHQLQNLYFALTGEELELKE